MTDQSWLDNAIRKIPDFPKPGILFYDITGIFMRPSAFQECIRLLSEAALRMKADALAAVEARGFVFASPMAAQLGLPLILVRKKGKLPGKTLSRTFDLEYGSDTIEVHAGDLEKGKRILLVDDLIATGGTLKAAADLITEAGCSVAGVLSVIGLPFLNYENLLKGIPVETLINYHVEQRLGSSDD